MTEQSNWQVPFFIIWSGQAVSMVGSALVRFALIWWLTEKTGSAIVLTTATIIATLPVILLGPFAGALVDRWNRRWTMVIADGLIALFTAALAYLYWIEVVEVWHVYLVLFLRSFGDVFQTPAMRASTSLLVPQDQLTRVGGMNETLMGVVNIVSPPLGALLIEVIGVQGTLAIDLLTALLAIGPLLFIAIPHPEDRAQLVENPSIFSDMIEGFRYVWHWRGLLFMFLVLSGMRFFLAPSFSLLPLMVTDHFGGTALELGWINSAHGFGFIAGGFILSLWGGFKRQTVTAVLGLVGVGVGSILFSLIPANAFWLALVVMFLRTMMVPMIRGPVLAIFQAYVPPEMQGRVFTLLLSSISLMAPFGLAVSGPVADTFGVPMLFLLSGIGCLGIALLWGSNAKIMHLEAHMEQDSN